MKKRKFDQELVDWRPVWEGDNKKLYDEALGSARMRIASLRELRMALGLSQADAAARLATSQSNVSKMEAKSEPTLSTLRHLIGDDGELRLVARLKDGSDVEIALGD